VLFGLRQVDLPRDLDLSTARRPPARRTLAPMGSRRAGPPWLSPLQPGRRRRRPRGLVGAVASCLLVVAVLLAATLTWLVSPLAAAAVLAALLCFGAVALVRS
jgi:hypothetical protein